jgi:hypothetical protein
MTRERYRAAWKRHPEVAHRVEATIATDEKGFYESIPGTDVLVAWQFPRDELFAIAPRIFWQWPLGRSR